MRISIIGAISDEKEMAIQFHKEQSQRHFSSLKRVISSQLGMLSLSQQDSVKKLMEDFSLNEFRVKCTPGPGETHIFPPFALAYREYLLNTITSEKQIVSGANHSYYDLLNIPYDFRMDEKNERGYYISHTKGGTDGAEKALLSFANPEKTYFLNHAETFSDYPILYYQKLRKNNLHKFILSEGNALEVDSELFEYIKKNMEEIGTFFALSNVTQTGVNNLHSIIELIKYRNDQNLETTFIIDGVSEQIVGLQSTIIEYLIDKGYARNLEEASSEAHKYLGDCFFTAAQKDIATIPSGGYGYLLVNEFAIQQSTKIHKKFQNLYFDSKMSALSQFKYNGDLMSPSGQIAYTPDLEVIERGRLQNLALLNYNAGDITYRDQKKTKELFLDSIENGIFAEIGLKKIVKNSKYQSRTIFAMKLPKYISGEKLLQKLREKYNIHLSLGYYDSSILRMSFYSSNGLSQFLYIEHGIADIIKNYKIEILK